MDIYDIVRKRKLQIMLLHNAKFQEIFGVSISEYYISGPGFPLFDFDRLFKELGVPLDGTSIETMRRKYGSEAVDLIGELVGQI